MGSKKMTKAQLKEVIVDLKMRLVEANVPEGHCPYTYHSLQNPISDCNSIDCSACHEIFHNNMRELIVAEVTKM